MVKTIEGLISVKFIARNDKVFQHFIIEKKKGVSKYLMDTRFVVYDKFMDKIKSHALSNSEDFSFIDRRDEEDRIVLEFDIVNKENFQKPKNYYFVIPGFVPPSPGCEFCKYRQDHDDTFFYCTYKEKMLNNKMKNCQFYRQSVKLFKT